MRERMADLISKEDDCWIWLGRMSNGRAVYGSPQRIVYRVLWEQQHYPLERRQRLYRTCDEERCVNPDHCSLTRPPKDKSEAQPLRKLKPYSPSVATPVWFSQAACRGGDPSMFYERSRYPEALAVCEGCPVRDDCLALATEANERHGVWGGKVFDVG